jgi:hypothetical protein
VNPHLIELQDHSLSIRAPGEILAQSPGFASIAGKAPVFGEEARQIARLHPRESLNQFWGQLSMDPLGIKTPHFRHTADIAHSHLQALTRDVDFEHGAILGVPSSYSRNQLGVLLGIVRQCPFNAVGLVDLALLQAAGSEADECIVIDLQLHQAVLTRFQRLDGMLVKDKVTPVPAAGLLALQDAWTNMITDEFLRQSRFDPKHNAETEQYLYNQLENWIDSCRSNNELQVELNHKGTVYQAQLAYDQFIQRSRNVYARIVKELEVLKARETALHIRTSHLHLPGLTLNIPGLIALDEDITLATCLQHLDHIRRPADNLQFITKLPVAKSIALTSAAALPARLPTHVLMEHKAVALPSGKIAFGKPASTLNLARVVPLPAGTRGSVVIERQPRAVVATASAEAGLMCNGAPLETSQPLQLGDVLAWPNGPTLQLITVE